ncbi:hypothetical protein AAZX31_07G036000 [Glycine max]|nr:hypothetical protein GYH30_017317 [Glycine max]
MVAALSYRTLSLVSMNTTLGLVIFKRFSNSFMDELNVVPESREAIGGGLYKLHHTLPLNVSEYILQALKPRTPEITVSAMSCNARDDPGFVFATSGRAVSINYCSLVRESHILIVYVSIMFLFCLVCLKR